ncbi:MAG: N(4)-(beta-N-acetylglucosaminyl)-L-asparaginase [Anaerolineae bacterium]
MQIVICNEGGGVGLAVAAGVLRGGGSALDAVEQGIRPVEADPDNHTVGRGGWPNLLGQVELDACIMDGSTLRSGAVGAVQGYPHPISIARQVMERLPHVLLVGEGAARFASECGLEQGENLTEEARAYWERWRAANTDETALARLAWRAADPMHTHGTTVYLARDAHGHMAAGVSTSGWALKYPGRLGDSPLLGAGSYVDDRYGAAACIGQGELTIRASTARSVVLYLKMGLGLRAACHEAMRDLQHMSADLLSFVMVHALSAQGEHYALCWGNHPDPRYWVARPDDGHCDLQSADMVGDC